MKLRYIAAIVLMAIMPAVLVTQPATATTTVATSTPSVERLKPASSTFVAAGANVNVTYNFKNVIARPYITLYFRKNYGASQAVNLNVSTDYIVVPSTWTSGTYSLDSVVIESIDGSKGKHFRNRLYIGTDASGNTSRTYTHLSLSAMDIHVTG